MAENHVLTFIDKFKFRHGKELEDIFMSGNCYYFALILKERFYGTIYYLPIANHFVCKIDKDYYDITGKAAMQETPYRWDEYCITNKKHAARVTRDCIKLLSR